MQRNYQEDNTNQNKSANSLRNSENVQKEINVTTNISLFALNGCKKENVILETDVYTKIVT